MFLGAMLAYLVALGGAAVWRSRQAHSGEGFLVAGRALPAPVLLLTLLSAWIGSGSLFAGAGLGYRSGFSALWQPAGAWAGIALLVLLAPRLRRPGRFTVADILEEHYGVTARLLGTVAVVLAYTTIAAHQFRGGGRLLNLVAGIDPVIGALAMALFCVAVTALGGMRSVASLDVGNGVVMVAGVGVAIVYLAGRAGGFAPALSALRPDQVTLFGTLSPAAALALFVPTMVLLLGEASVYQKLLAARDDRAVRLGLVGWMAATLVLETLLIGVGMFASVALPALNAAQSEGIIVRVALGVLPTVFGMLLLVAATAIVVSAANSVLLTAATSLAHGTYRRFVDPQVDDRRLVMVIRALIVALGVVALVIGSLMPAILARALWAYTMYGAAITPALLAALVWPAVSRRAGVASIAVGMITTLVWEIIAMRSGHQPLGLQTIYPALLLAIATLIGGSVLLKPAVGQSETI